MGCRDCGQAAKAVANCKTFTFPLGGGEVDIVFRGAFAKEDVTDGMPAFADFAMHTMAHLAPTREELAKRESQGETSPNLFAGVRANG